MTYLELGLFSLLLLVGVLGYLSYKHESDMVTKLVKQKKMLRDEISKLCEEKLAVLQEKDTTDLEKEELNMKCEKLRKDAAFYKSQIQKAESQIREMRNDIKELKLEAEESNRKFLKANTQLIRAQLKGDKELRSGIPKKQLKQFLRIKSEADYDRFVKLLKELGYLESKGRGMHTRYTLWKRS